MSRKLSGFLALTMTYFLISYLSFLVREWQFVDAIPGIIGPAVFGLGLALLVGLCGGAVREGGFQPTFYWTYVAAVSAVTLLFLATGIHYLVRTML